MQSGSYDCGLFAIAFATALAHGCNPGSYDQQNMRQHLSRCLQNKKMEMFEKTRRTGMRKIIKTVDFLEVYCTCRMPEISGMDMVQCCKCNEWYHMHVNYCVCF